MFKNDKKKKMDFKCKSCKHKANIEELEELGFIETVGKTSIIECPKCGEFNCKK